jgi:hypothetical protein
MDAVDVLNGVIAVKDAEIQRLGDDLENAYRLIRERHDIIGYERALADDLAAVLSTVLDQYGTFHAEDEVERVLDRWREARK